MDARELAGLSREELIVRAENLGVARPSVLTRAELIDEIRSLQVADSSEQRLVRGLFGVARDLLASVVERGLHLPEAAAVIRGPRDDEPWTPPKPPLATVTLAEIYAAQGHKNRALAILGQVLAHDPDHAIARALRDKLLIASEPPPAPTETEESEGLEPLEPAASEADELPVAPASSSSLAMVAPPPSEPAERPVPMLDDEPLPPRYEVDEIVALPVDPHTLYTYWEVRAETLEEARSEAEDGQLVVRVVAVTATWDGPVVHTRDIEVQAWVGDWFVRELPAGAILRAALGWRSSRGFQPLAIALEIGAPPALPSRIAATRLARFTEREGAVSIDAAEFPQASAYVRAVAAYQRKLARTVASESAVEAAAASEAGGEAGAPAEVPSVAFGSPSSSGWASG